MPTTSAKMVNYSDDELRRLAEEAHRQDHDLTREQRALIHLDARYEARRMLRRYRNSGVIGFLVLLIGLFAVRASDLANTTESRRAIARSGDIVAITGCNRDFRTQAIQRDVLVQNFKLERRQAELLVPLPDCTKIQGVVTTDPEKAAVKNPPAPLGPKDEQKVLREYWESVGE